MRRKVERRLFLPLQNTSRLAARDVISQLMIQTLAIGREQFLPYRTGNSVHPLRYGATKTSLAGSELTYGPCANQHPNHGRESDHPDSQGHQYRLFASRTPPAQSSDTFRFKGKTSWWTKPQTSPTHPHLLYVGKHRKYSRTCSFSAHSSFCHSTEWSTGRYCGSRQLYLQSRGWSGKRHELSASTSPSALRFVRCIHQHSI